MIKVGIIGCGTITRLRHAPEYTENQDAQIVALYDMNRERAEEIAKEFGGTVCGSVEELLAMDLDAVSVCTSNNLHAEMTIQALEAGRHVLCEKPMAVSLEQCEAMVEAAKRAGKKLMLGHNQRFSPAHQEAHRMVAAGEIGRVLSFETKFGHGGPEVWCGVKHPWFFQKGNAGLGALADLGIHKIDLTHYILGEQIIQVSGLVRTLDKTMEDGSPIEVDDNAICTLVTESGAIGNLNVSWTYYGNEKNTFVVYGSEGVIRCYDDENSSLILEKDGKTYRYNLEVMVTNADQTLGNRTSTGVIDEFISSIIEDREPLTSGEESLKAMRVVFSLVESTKTGLAVQIRS